MGCICGCDVNDHLHNLSNGPPSSNSFFEDFWAPNFAEVLTYRLKVVLDESEPSKRISWRLNYGGDVQDIVPPFHKWAKTPDFMDIGRPTPRLPTPNFDEIMEEEQKVHEELLQDWHRYSNNPGVAQERSSPSNGEYDSQAFLPSANRAMDAGSFAPKIAASNPFPYVLNQQDLSSSMKPAARNQPIQHDQGHITSYTSLSGSTEHQFEKLSPVEFHSHRPTTSEASRDAACIEEQNRDITESKAEAFKYEDGRSSQSADLHVSIAEECLCGCDGDAICCLLPNMPPSPNTYFESCLAPEFAVELKLLLERAVRNLEPSRRIWWREEFGGCALDRRPLVSETCTMKADDLGYALITSPPLFQDLTMIGNKALHQSSRKRQRSMSLPYNAVRSQDRLGTPPEDYNSPFTNASKSTPLYESSKKCRMSTTEFADHRRNVGRGRPFIREPFIAPLVKAFKSPTHYIPDKIPPIQLPHISRERPLRHMRKKLTAEERKQLRESAMQKLEASRQATRRYFAEHRGRRQRLPLEATSAASDWDNIKQVQSEMKVEKKTPSTELLQQLNQSLYQNIEAMKLRKNSHYGTAVHRHDQMEFDILPSTLHTHATEELRWKKEDPYKTCAADQRQRSFDQKLEVTKLRRVAVTL